MQFNARLFLANMFQMIGVFAWVEAATEVLRAGNPTLESGVTALIASTCAVAGCLIISIRTR